MSLATDYRPQTFDDVIEQTAIVRVLKRQIENGTIKNAYLLCGPSGDGKTTIAKIFANTVDAEITELDAASHSGVDDVREIIEKSKFQPIGRKYKCFIIDECHSLSNSAWQALLLTLEEPTPTSIFIFCTTDPQKIPATVANGRVRRFNFSRISNDGILNRLKYIIDCERQNGKDYTCDEDALSYIVKRARGGMRFAISMLESVFEYDNHATLETVCTTLGTADYVCMFDLARALWKMDKKHVIEIVESLDADGVDLKIFIKEFTDFILDLCKFNMFKNLDLCKIPDIYTMQIESIVDDEFTFYNQLLNELLNIGTNIKWESNPKPLIEATFIILCSEV